MKAVPNCVCDPRDSALQTSTLAFRIRGMHRVGSREGAEEALGEAEEGEGQPLSTVGLRCGVVKGEWMLFCPPGVSGPVADAA